MVVCFSKDMYQHYHMTCINTGTLNKYCMYVPYIELFWRRGILVNTFQNLSSLHY